MKSSKPTDREIWDAMEILSRAISWTARESVIADPRGLEGPALENLQAEKARVASMELSNTIQEIFKKYKIN